MSEDILPEGLRFFPKHEKAPDFVLATLIITPNDLFTFCKAHLELMTEYDGKKQLKLQIKNSKAGKMYASVDTYKPEPKAAHKPEEDPEKLPF